MGEAEFTKLSFRQWLAGLGVDNLGQEVVFVEMGAVLTLALETDTGTADLTQSVDVVGLDAQRLLQLHTHVLCPWLSTKGSDAQLELFPGPF